MGKMELQQEISSLSKVQEETEQQAWHEEMRLANIKERVRILKSTHSEILGVH